MTQQSINIHSRPNRSYELAPYDPEWKKRYEDIASKVAPLFGENLIQMEHVGSTSVAGMIAKPTIDISTTVHDLKQVKLLYDKMIALGFRPLGDFIQQAEPEEYFVMDGGTPDERLVNLHVMAVGNPEIEDMITLRDYLRENPSARDAYNEHKQTLMRQYTDKDYNSYSRYKRAFLEDLKNQARLWQSQK